MPDACPECGGDEFEFANGESVCVSCGRVVESHQIVSEVEFGETAGGGAYAVGQVVTSDGHILGSSYRGRQTAAYFAERRMKEYAQFLKLSDGTVKVATNIFKQALSKNLTRGRRSALNLGAILYLACRIQQTSHMLMDISEVVQENVNDLGRIYKHIASDLMMRPYTSDPSLYLERYSSQLDLGQKRFQIQKTSGKLLQRMKRDWIHIGRRPNGLCGAALFIACRYHEEPRTLDKVAKVVSMDKQTIRMRLKEFLDTPSSKLTLEQLYSQKEEEDDTGDDPPAFKRLKLKNRKNSKRRRQDESFREAITEILNRQIDYASDIPNDIDEITAASLGINETIEELMGTDEITKDISEILKDEEIMDIKPIELDEDSEISDIDDETIRKIYIRTPEEIKERIKSWNEANSNYLKREREKKKRKDEEDEEVNDNGKKRKRRKITPSKNVNEAIQKIASIKKLPKFVTNPTEKNSKASKRALAQKFTPEVNEMFKGILTDMMSELNKSKQIPNDGEKDDVTAPNDDINEKEEEEEEGVDESLQDESQEYFEDVANYENTEYDDNMNEYEDLF